MKPTNFQSLALTDLSYSLDQNFGGLQVTTPARDWWLSVALLRF